MKITLWELPNEEDIIAMRKDLGMSEASLRQDVQILKHWLRQQPHLPVDIDGTRLERLLFYCKNSLERSKQKLEQYFSLKSAAPEVFLNRDATDPLLYEQNKIVFNNPLPRLTEDNNRVCLLKVVDPSRLKELDVEAWMKRTFMCYDLRMTYEHSANDLYLDDLENCDASFLKYVTPTLLSKIVSYGNMAYPYRIKQVVIYKPPKVLEAFINICKTLVNKKLASRVVTVSNNEELHKYISKSCLPKEYGGDEERSLDEIRDAIDKELMKNKAWFDAEEKNKSDESKRIGNSSSTVAEMTGSFRKIAFD
nr:PREDICTED: alpha-tocopherol transfer protein-like [Bemisia tabaci]